MQVYNTQKYKRCYINKKIKIEVSKLKYEYKNVDKYTNDVLYVIYMYIYIYSLQTNNNNKKQKEKNIYYTSYILCIYIYMIFYIVDYRLQNVFCKLYTICFIFMNKINMIYIYIYIYIYSALCLRMIHYI